jgi:hypothetical protein
MADNLCRTDVPAGNFIKDRLGAIYASGDESAVNKLTNLVINVLQRSDDDSRSRLMQFFELPTVSETQSHGAEIDHNLIARAHLFINDNNANRVQSWISLYETSSSCSPMRSLLEGILQAFVTSRSEVETMKFRTAEARKLSTDAEAKCAALKSVLENILNPKTLETSFRSRS